jgi:hypothetical protein
MPDWQELVRRHLTGLALDPAEKDQVYAELASHLEESYESLRQRACQSKPQFSKHSRWLLTGKNYGYRLR